MANIARKTIFDKKPPSHQASSVATKSSKNVDSVVIPKAKKNFSTLVEFLKLIAFYFHVLLL